MTRRMAMAFLAVVGLFIAGYLTLYHYGLIGTLICSTHGCDTVQASNWSKLMGLPVAAWGLGYYALVLILTLAGIEERFANSRPLSLTLLVLTGWGVVFSGWLTYLEGFRINAWCQWCIGSATVAVLLFLVCLADWRATSADSSTPA